MSEVLPCLYCFICLLACQPAAGQETDIRTIGFLSSKVGWVFDFGSLATLISDGGNEGGECVAQNIWDVTQGATSDLSYLKSNSGKAWGSIILIIIVAGSTFCLLWGHQLMKPCLFISAFLAGYYVGMSLSFLAGNWIEFNLCSVPLFIGIGLGVFAGIIAMSLVDKAVFLFGAVIGLIVALMAKQCIIGIVVHNGITNDTVATLLNWYWLIAIGCGIAGGCFLQKHEDRVFAVATVLVGAWGLSISVTPLLAVWGVTVAAWAPLVTFCIAIVVGAVAQRR